MRSFFLLFVYFCLSVSSLKAELTADQERVVDEFIALFPEDFRGLLANPIVGGDMWESKTQMKDFVLQKKALGIEIWDEESSFFTADKKAEIFTKIGEMNFLNELAICNFGLEEVPEVVFELTNLNELDLSCNRLSTVPLLLMQMTHLSKLYLNHNNFKYIPSAITHMFANENFQLYLDGSPLYQNSFGNAWGINKLKERFEDRVSFSGDTFLPIPILPPADSDVESSDGETDEELEGHNENIFYNILPESKRRRFHSPPSASFFER